jgi:hypothetical protein
LYLLLAVLEVLVKGAGQHLLEHQTMLKLEGVAGEEQLD